MNPPRDLTGVILAGGSSRRMGQPKAGLTLPDGRTLLEASADALRRVADDVVIIGAPTIETNFDVIPDDAPGDGPLARARALPSASPITTCSTARRSPIYCPHAAISASA